MRNQLTVKFILQADSDEDMEELENAVEDWLEEMWESYEHFSRNDKSGDPNIEIDIDAWTNQTGKRKGRH